MSLRKNLIRLAAENPELQPKLLPLLSKQGAKERNPLHIAALKEWKVLKARLDKWGKTERFDKATLDKLEKASKTLSGKSGVKNPKPRDKVPFVTPEMHEFLDALGDLAWGDHGVQFNKGFAMKPKAKALVSKAERAAKKMAH